MPLKKKKEKEETKVDLREDLEELQVEGEIIEEVEEIDEPMDEEAYSYDTESTLGSTEDNPSTMLLNGANKLVSSVFGLDDSYTLLQFADKGSKAILTLGSSNFVVTVTIMGNEYYSLKARLGLIEE